MPKPAILWRNSCRFILMVVLYSFRYSSILFPVRSRHSIPDPSRGIVSETTPIRCGELLMGVLYSFRFTQV